MDDYLSLMSNYQFVPRDVYYKDPALFQTQATVDRIIDDIAYSFRLPRAAFNVVLLTSTAGVAALTDHCDQVAAAKGLVVGAMRVVRRSEILLEGHSNAEARIWSSLPAANYLQILPGLIDTSASEC